MNSNLKNALRQTLTEARAASISIWSVREFQRLRNASNLKVHLGCGNDVRPGWINIDLRLGRNGHDVSRTGVFINFDLRRGLPLGHNSCDLIYASHLLEHLDLGHGEGLLRDCYRVLSGAGRMRIVVPNFAAIFRAYVDFDWKYFEILEGHRVLQQTAGHTDSLADYLNYCVYQYGEHRCIYDRQMLNTVLRRSGFSRAETSEFDSSIDVDSDLRRAYSLYTDAWK